MLRCLFVAALSTCVNAGADFPDYDLEILKARANAWRLVFPDTLSLILCIVLGIVQCLAPAAGIPEPFCRLDGAEHDEARARRETILMDSTTGCEEHPAQQHPKDLQVRKG